MLQNEDFVCANPLVDYTLVSDPHLHSGSRNEDFMCANPLMDHALVSFWSSLASRKQKWRFSYANPVMDNYALVCDPQLHPRNRNYADLNMCTKSTCELCTSFWSSLTSRKQKWRLRVCETTCRLCTNFWSSIAFRKQKTPSEIPLFTWLSSARTVQRVCWKTIDCHLGFWALGKAKDRHTWVFA